MTDASLAKEQNMIERYIDRFAKEKTTPDAEPMPDGVVDSQKYLEGKYRICWVLKEPYDKDYDAGEGGGWSVTGALANRDAWSALIRSSTYKPIIYVTHSLLNGLKSYSEVEKWFDENKEAAAECLSSIAVINISKMPGASNSNDADIAQKYEYWRPILFWQLRQYQPQIVIFGNTFQHFQADIGIKDEELIQGQGVSQEVIYVVKDHVLYIWAYHPAQMIITREKYVQGITNVVKLNLEK
ncbi:hypothetical protein FACS1894110_26200 [Spirochaetia bacterium]|nr:hypothetical protein FACS1894110_26200 [Spirochaetia bacterium]